MNPRTATVAVTDEKIAPIALQKPADELAVIKRVELGGTYIISFCCKKK